MGEITYFPEDSLLSSHLHVGAPPDYKIKRQAVKASHYFTVQHF